MKVSEKIHTHGIVQGIFYENSNQRLYLACNNAGLEIWDVSTPTNPVKLGSFITPGWALDVYVSGSYAYAADYDAGVQIYENLLLGIEEEEREINVLTSFILRNSSFTFELPHPMDVSITIYDVAGKLVKTNEGRFNKGKNYIRCDSLKSGIYFYRIRYGVSEKKREVCDNLK